jgi:outer membrane protein
MPHTPQPKDFLRGRLCGLYTFLPIALSCVLLPTGYGAGAQALTQAESVAAALRQSPQVRVAKAVRDASMVEAERGKPVARPTLDARASGILQGPRATFPRPDGSLATVLPEEVGRLDLILEQPLYRAGGRAARERYGASLSETEWEYRRALAAVALAVRKAYIDVLRAEAGVRTAQDGLAAAQRAQELVTRQIAAGLAKPVDAETAKGQIAEAQGGVTQATSALSLARMNFNRTLGRPLTTAVVLDPLPEAPKAPESPDAAIAAALKQRPELQLLGETLKGAQAGIALAKAQAQPGLNFRGLLSEQTPSAFVREHYAAGILEIRWSILDAGKTRLDTQQAKAQTSRVEALREDARQGVALEVTQAWQQMRDAQEKIGLTRIQREALEATATVAEKAYEVGRGTLIEVQAVQREVRSARTRETQALYDLHTSAADFAHAQGEDVP